ncbi:MAG: RDD family protein [Candidatus Nitrosocosmicus sp.]
MMDNSSSSNKRGQDIVLAKWTDRFLAWLIDFIIITIGIIIISLLIFLFSLLLYPDSFTDIISHEQSVVKQPDFWVSSIVFFLYWFYFESTSGQSIGKRVLNIKTTNLEGNTAKRKDIAIESFGKSFLLPFDVILGWIFTNEKRQRLFGRLGNTIVIKVKTKDLQMDSNFKYIKD